MRRIVSAPQSTAASAAGIHAKFIVVDSLDKKIQNKKELIRLASIKGGWGGLFCIYVGSVSSTWLGRAFPFSCRRLWCSLLGVVVRNVWKREVIKKNFLFCKSSKVTLPCPKCVDINLNNRDKDFSEINPQQK